MGLGCLIARAAAPKVISRERLGRFQILIDETKAVLGGMKSLLLLRLESNVFECLCERLCEEAG